MEATIRILQRFNGITTGSYMCHACCGAKSELEYTPKYTLIFLLKGSFRHTTFRQSDFLTSQLVLFKKPEFDYRVLHEHYIHDDCFFIEFCGEVLEHLSSSLSPVVRRFIKSLDLPSIVLKSDPWKHLTTWNLCKLPYQANTLQAQDTVLDLISSTLGGAEYSTPVENKVLHDSIDKAKLFMIQNYFNDISIDDVASASHVSTFHFSRVFRNATGLSPHQFLTEIRIKNVRKLLTNTDLSVADVGYNSGFSNPDYFVTLFKKKTGNTPTYFRSEPGKKRNQ